MGAAQRAGARIARCLATPAAVLLAWAAVRVWAISVAVHVLGSDVRLFARWSDGLAGGSYPTGDPSWQYPPLVGPLLALPRWLRADPEGGLYALFLVADLVTLVVLLVAGRRRDAPWCGTVASWAWAVVPLVIGPILLARFDTVPTLLAVLGLVQLGADPPRARRGGAALGIGGLLKLWPLLLLLAAPRQVWRRAATSLAITTAAVVGGLWWWSRSPLSFAGNQAARGLQVEAVAALPFVLAHAAGCTVDVTSRYGSQEVDAAGAGVAAVVVTVLAVVLLGALALLRWRGRLDGVPVGDVALVVVLVAVATSRVWSPQYNVWIAGVACAALLDRATRMRPAMLLLAATGAVTWFLYPGRYGSLLRGGPVGTGLQAARVVLLLAALVAAWRGLLRAPERSLRPGGRRPWRRGAAPSRP